jgi:hypothetical protein
VCVCVCVYKYSPLHRPLPACSKLLTKLAPITQILVSQPLAVLRGEEEDPFTPMVGRAIYTCSLICGGKSLKRLLLSK